jgi:uncharacterized membrane protein
MRPAMPRVETVTGEVVIHRPVRNVYARRVSQLIRYQTRGPALLRARWQLEFAAGDDAATTRVREQLTVPPGRIGRTLLALIGKFPGREVEANLNRLKEVLEGAPKAGERGTP